MSETCDGRHYCEPPHWPTALGQTYTCDECGRHHESFNVAANRDRLRIPAFITTPPDSFGWTGKPSEDAP